MIDLLTSVNETADYNYVAELIAHARAASQEISDTSENIKKFLGERGADVYSVRSESSGRDYNLYDLINAYLFVGPFSFAVLGYPYDEASLLEDVREALLKPSSAPCTVLLEDLRFPTRIHNTFRRRHITTVAEIAAMTTEELSAIRGLGPRSVEIIVDTLKKHGYEPHSDSETQKERSVEIPD